MAHTEIRLRRGKAAFWASENPTLRDGEPGYEKDTRKLKIGDGVTPWNELPYSSGSSGPLELPDDSALQAHIDDLTPHPVYDDGPSLSLLYANAKV